MSVTINGSGQVPVQVVSMTTTTPTTTSSMSWSATALTLSITPQSTTSKILILVNTGFQSAISGQPQITVFRGATNLGGGSQSCFVSSYNGGGGDWRPASIVYLDSPSTTASTTYTVNLNSQVGSVTMAPANLLSTLTLLEISGS